MQVLAVRWRVAPAAVPRVLRHCPRCECERPFESSGRFRINAQKKRLDAWLIYGCGHCGRTWNLPVFERLNVRDVDPALLDRLHANCPVLAAERGSDVAVLARHVRGIEPAAAEVGKEVVAGTAAARLLRIEIAFRGMQRLRLDRLLAAELRQSRACIARWVAAGTLTVLPDHRFVQGGQEVRVVLAELNAAECGAVVAAAVGAKPT
jgi:hypothetical protein